MSAFTKYSSLKNSLTSYSINESQLIQFEPEEKVKESLLVKEIITSIVGNLEHSISLLINKSTFLLNFFELRMPLLKLCCFQAERSNNESALIRAHTELKLMISQSPSSELQTSLSYLNFLISDSTVIKSYFYSEKEKQFITLIEGVVDFKHNQSFITSKFNSQGENTESDFSPFKPNLMSLNLEILKNLEKELMLYHVCFIKNSFTKSFDEFMFISQIKFDFNNMYVNNLIINEFCLTSEFIFVSNHFLNKSLSNISNASTTTSLTLCQCEVVQSKESKVSTKVQESTFKILKRENIDKKIIRKYRKFLSELSKKKLIDINDSLIYNFCKGYIIPPFKNKEVEFKSMNTSYLVWLVTQQRLFDHYEEFVKENLKKISSSIIQNFSINDKEEIEYLKNYIKSFTRIYENRLVS